MLISKRSKIVENTVNINLQSYNSSWPREFEREKEKLQCALGDIVEKIEHIGSTAIPSIHAKPVIDILIGVNKLEDFNNKHIENIESLGYQYIKEYEKELPYRRFFLKNDTNQNRTHNIHLVNYHSAWWHRHVLFRDYLKKNLNAAKEYEALKIQLAETINASMNDKECQKYFFERHIFPFPKLVQEYHKLRETLGDMFTIGNQYAMAKSRLVQSINKKAYFDFDNHLPDMVLNRLNGYIPQTACFEEYKTMFQDPDFVKCYGIKLTNERLHQILERDACHWDQYRYGTYAWFDKETKEFVGEGGLNHAIVDDHEEIELTYSLSKHYWGHGLAAEIGQFAIDYAFNTLKLNNIVCFTMTTNQQSQRVIEKLGFKYEKDFTYKSLPHKLFRLTNTRFNND